MRHTFVAALPLAALLGGHLPAAVLGNAGVFTYYDDPFTAPGSSEILQVGPASWRKLLIPNNQCGGIGQQTGYGQSPVVIHGMTAEKCDADLSGYQFKGGDCSFLDLNFRIVTNGVIVGPKAGNGCSLGRMKIPGRSNWFDALQFHIHTSSEHSLDGKYYPAELHVVHRESNGRSFAVFGTFIDRRDDNDDAAATGNASDSGAHEIFESYLQGWEAVAAQTNEYCAAIPGGSGVFTPNRLFDSRQQRRTCPPVGYGVTVDDVDALQWVDETAVNAQTGATLSTRVPQLKTPDFPAGSVPSLYESLPTDSFGIYTYRGGLTTPPCTEIVNWNLLDAPMYVSPRQLDRLYALILCFVERSTCRHATVASAFGGTNRPPQPLNGRKILHRCPDGPPSADGGAPLDDPIPPVTAMYAPPPQPQPWMAVLYPWFVMALGFIVFFILSRWLHVLPYTAVMFVLGTLMGVGIASLRNTDQLTVSTSMWSNINSELLLLVFLPGLLFRDAFCLNVYLLKDALGQCLIMAFPMVLAGTALLALVGFYVLPYGWSFSLSMTFGAILSATDPVAVSALLNEVGAPPRLKMHISGESLLNDGSAIVFYTIFAAMFLYELGIPGLGYEIDVRTGVALFFRMSLGAVAIGFAYGLGLVRVLFLFNRRFQTEESIVQVTATITVAYLCYYVADAVCRTSGVLAVVTCGIVTKAFGYNMINDKVMMEKFWVLVEHLLNTLIFALGGVVWGTVISNSDPRRAMDFTGKDWGYLILVYILMMAVRFFLFAVAFPLIGRIGLKSSWREAVFISFGGLRGAVGIAMAIALDNELRRDTLPGDPRRDFTSQLFGLTGGIALLTLLINGTLCGPLLRKLGLADSTEMREIIVHRFRQNVMQHVLDQLLQLLSDPRYKNADFEVIKRHVPSLRDVTANELKLAVKRNKANTPTYKYKNPNLESFGSIVCGDSMRDLNSLARASTAAMLRGLVSRVTIEEQNDNENEHADEETLVELRKIFIELLRYAYEQQIKNGEVEVREGLVVFTLENSLEYAADAVAEGKPICDWEMLQKISNPWTSRTKEILEMPAKEQIRDVRRRSTVIMQGIIDVNKIDAAAEWEGEKAVTDVQRAVAFIGAHQVARKLFKEDFCGNRFLTKEERAVMDESWKQAGKAEELLQSKDSAELKNIVSHLLSTILLNKAASFIGNLVTQGLLREQEGEEYMHELVEHEVHTVGVCAKKKRCEKIEEEELNAPPENVDVEDGAPVDMSKFSHTLETLKAVKDHSAAEKLQGKSRNVAMNLVPIGEPNGEGTTAA